MPSQFYLNLSPKEILKCAVAIWYKYGYSLSSFRSSMEVTEDVCHVEGLFWAVPHNRLMGLLNLVIIASDAGVTRRVELTSQVV